MGGERINSWIENRFIQAQSELYGQVCTTDTVRLSVIRVRLATSTSHVSLKKCIQLNLHKLSYSMARQDWHYTRKGKEKILLEISEYLFDGYAAPLSGASILDSAGY